MDMNIIFQNDEDVADDFPSLDSDGFLIMGEEEESREEEVFLKNDQPFDLSPSQLRMVSYNIMAEVRRKYDLRPRLNAPNFRRE